MAEIPTKAVLNAARAYCVHGDHTDPAWAPCDDCYRIVELMISLAAPILCNWVSNRILAEERKGVGWAPSGVRVTYGGGMRRGAAIAKRAFDDKAFGEALPRMTEAVEAILRGEGGAG